MCLRLLAVSELPAALRWSNATCWSSDRAVFLLFWPRSWVRVKSSNVFSPKTSCSSSGSEGACAMEPSCLRAVVLQVRLLLRWHLSRGDAQRPKCQIHTYSSGLCVDGGGCMSRTFTCRFVANYRAPAPPTATDCRDNSTWVFTKPLRVDKETLHEPMPPSRCPSTGFHRPR